MVKSVKVHFRKSKKVLIKYLKMFEKNPTEKEWDQYAVLVDCLSSKTMSYMYGDKFSKMCQDLRKELKKSL